MDRQNKSSAPMALIHRTLTTLGILTTLTLVQGCKAEDLGHRSADRVAVRGTGWDEGAAAIIATKCATCHRADRSDFVPANTPGHLDGMAERSFYGDPANLSRIMAMARRVNETPEVPMPPLFATPLFDDEKAALSAFLASTITALTPAPREPGLTDCPRRPPPEAEITRIVGANCAGCHASPPRRPGMPAITNAAEWAAVQDLAMSLIAAGAMPPGNPNFAASPDGQALQGIDPTCAKPDPAGGPGTTTPDQPGQPPHPAKVEIRLAVSATLDRADGTPWAPPATVWTDVEPVFKARCAGCHSAADDIYRVRLDTFPFEHIDGLSQQAVAALIMERVKSTDEFLRMPQGEPEPLPSATIGLLTAWEAAGMPTVRPPDPLDGAAVTCAWEADQTGAGDGARTHGSVLLGPAGARQWSGKLPPVDQGVELRLTCTGTAGDPKVRFEEAKERMVAGDATTLHIKLKARLIDTERN